MGPEIYWNIRASSPSVRQYLTLYFRGDRASQSWHDVFTAGQSIEFSLEEIYRREGYSGICRALETDDKLEHWLTRVAAPITYHQPRSPQTFLGIFFEEFFKIQCTIL